MKKAVVLLLLIFSLFKLNSFSQEDLRDENFSDLRLSGFLINSSEISISIDTSTQLNVCQYPNAGLIKGNEIVPFISDKRRKEAIIKLIEKIIDCEKLPFKEDGQIFYNKEKKLPEMPKGYYREYTLIIPKDADKEFYIGDVLYTSYPSYGLRGPERIVIGGGKDIYYTPTHYDSFVKILIINSKQ